MSRERWIHPTQITLFVVALVMTITLLVFWNIYLVSDYSRIKDLMGKDWSDSMRWWVLAFGCFFFSFIIVVISFFFAGFMKRKKFVRMQGDFLNLTTHELKLPLANIRMFTQTLLRRDLEVHQVREFVKHIESEAKLLTTRVGHLLETRRIEQDDLPLEGRVMDLCAYLHEFVQGWKNPVDLDCKEKLWVRIDPYYMDHVMGNLLENAQKYAPESAPVIRIFTDRKYAVLEVVDSGPGVVAKDLRKIFNRFYRASIRKNPPQSGTGLGLYIARRIVEQHGGSIRAMNLPEHSGFCVRIQLKIVGEEEG